VKGNTLYHGPGAKDYIKGLSHHRMFFYGEEGLKVDDARSILDMVQIPPIGGKGYTVVIGPLEDATLNALDALLKTLEEPPEGFSFILWAYDLGMVRETVKSRCFHYYIAHQTSDSEEEPITVSKQAAVDAFKSALRGRTAWVTPLTSHEPTIVLEGLSEHFSIHPHDLSFEGWKSFRLLLQRSNPTIYMIIEWLLLQGSQGV
jgi:hypothetical protein